MSSFQPVYQGQTLTTAYGRAAEMHLQGYQALSAGIVGFADGIAKGIENSGMNKAKLSELQAKVGAAQLQNQYWARQNASAGQWGQEAPDPSGD
jgi:hypothetical protein